MRFRVSCLISTGASHGFSFWLSFTDARCGASVYGRSASTEFLIELVVFTIVYSSTNKKTERSISFRLATLFQYPFRPGTCALPKVRLDRALVPLPKVRLDRALVPLPKVRLDRALVPLPRGADKSAF